MRGLRRTAWIAGVGFWSSRLGPWSRACAVLKGEATLPADLPARPVAPLLAPTERRRAPDTVALALTVAADACAAAGLDPAGLPSVFASTHGDTPISDAMCSTLARDPRLTSPTRFHNSVHNAAAGYWSIATGSHAPNTAISACEATFGSGLLEALSQCVCEAMPVLLVSYDVEVRGPLSTVVASAGLLGLAFVVTPVRTERAVAQLDWRVRTADPARVACARSEFATGNALDACLPFAAALAGDRPVALRLPLGGSLALAVDVVPAHTAVPA
jgi:Beta-ketoacyl synthase, N-terminal domain